jgi:hypothetical protein
MILAGGAFLVTFGLLLIYWFVYIPYFEETTPKEVGEYTVKLAETDDEKKDFRHLYKQQIAHKAKPQKRDQIVDRLRETVESIENDMELLVAYHEGEAVATLALVDTAGHETLPITDPDDQFDFSDLREYGKVMELPYFSVNHDYRNDAALMSAVFGYAIEEVMKRGGVFLVVTAFKDLTTMYQRIGFERLNGLSKFHNLYDREHDILGMNLIQIIFDEEYSDAAENVVRAAVSWPYVWRYHGFDFSGRTPLRDLNITKLVGSKARNGNAQPSQTVQGSG